MESTSLFSSSPLRRLAQFTVIYGIGEMANYALAFLLVPIYTRILSPSQYGVLEVFNRTLEVLGIFAAVGIGMAAMRSYFGRENGEGGAKVFSSGMIFAVVNSLWIVLILSAFAGNISELLLGTRDYAPLFRLTFSILVFEQGFGLVRTYLKTTGRPRAFSVLSVSKYALTLGLIIALLFYWARDVKSVLVATLAANVIFFIPSALVLLSRIGYSISWPALKRMLSFGLPFVPGGLLLFVLNSADRFLLIAMVGQDEAGLYALGYRIALVPIMLLLAPFQAAWGPFMMEKGETSEGPRLFARILSYLIAAYCVVSLALALFAEEAVRVVASPAFAESYRVIPLVLLGYAFWVVSIILDAGIYITRKTVFKPLVLAAGAGTNIALNLLLIPRFGMMGAAYSTVAGFLVFVALTYVVSNRLYPLPLEKTRGLWALCGAVLIFVVHMLVPLDGYPGIAFKAGLLGLYLLLLRLSGFRSLRALLGMLRRSDPAGV
ncbi:MAG: oligosaccharide flippase family protein [Candidatus Eisenbacteria bacterium]